MLSPLELFNEHGFAPPELEAHTAVGSLGDGFAFAFDQSRAWDPIAPDPGVTFDQTLS